MTRTSSIGTGIRRTMAAFVVAGFALTSLAPKVEAQALAGGGKLYAVANCFLATNTAQVSVTVMNPDKFKATGLVYYVKLWAKGRLDANWTLIKQAQTGTIKTWKQINSYTWMNNPTSIFNGSFSGTDGTYEIFIQYWYKTPAATGWTPMYGFNLNADPDSHIFVISNDGYGNLWSETKTCSL